MTADSGAGRFLLSGAAVQRFELGADLALLHVREAGSSVLVAVSGRAGARGVGILERENQARAKALLGEPRRRMHRGALLGLDSSGVWITRGATRVRLGVPVDPNGPLAEQARDEGPPEEILALASARAAWVERGEALLEALEGSSLDAARRALAARIEREDARLARRMKAVSGDLERGREAGRAADAARVFVPEAARAARGTTALVVTDWSSGEPVRREMPLDPARRPQVQIEAIFTHARRMKKGEVVATARLEEARIKRASLNALLGAAYASTNLEELARACELAHRGDPALLPGLGGRSANAPTRDRSPRARVKPAVRVAYRTFLTSGGAHILVGRGAADNDELTLHVARPHDLWLHAKGQAGAHVVLRLMKGHEAPAELLVDAAHLAAHFSDARGEAVVEVTYAPRRHVRKRRGAPAGQVQVDREKVVTLRVDAGRLAALLAREEVS